MTTILIDNGRELIAIGLWEGPHNVGIVDNYKREARARGGRVIAVVRPKHVRP